MLKRNTKIKRKDTINMKILTIKKETLKIYWHLH